MIVELTPAEFAQWSIESMPAFYERGVRHFEIHNEPNLRLEGWQQSWQDGATPTSLVESKRERATSADQMTLKLAASGGAVVRVVPIR